MDDAQIFDGLKEILIDKFRVKESEVSQVARLEDDLGLDSVDIMDSVYLIEDKFKITLIDENTKPEDVGPLETVSDLLRLIKLRLVSS